MQTERLLNKELAGTLRQQDTPCEQPSLFADVVIDSRPASGMAVAVSSANANQRSRSDSSDHLAAAQGLAKKLRRGRRQASTRQRAGIAICQHLIALLHEGEQTERQQPN
jgi:hypothetical protein